MRKKLKVIGIALATILVICIVNNRKQILSFIPTDFSKVEMIYDNRTDDDMNVRYYYNHLSNNAKIAYTLIVPEAYKHTESIEIPKITDSEFTALCYAVSYDNPDLICFSSQCKIRTEGNRCYFEPNYTHSLQECNALTEKLNSQVDKVVNEASKLSSDYEKEKYVHDYVCEGCKYVLTDDLKSTAYDALVNGEAVCEGYARATQLLLNKLGVKNFLVIGDAKNDDGEIEPHMWNIVKINGNNYHLDVTWDDNDQTDSPDIKTHLYFNLTTKQISANHFNIRPENIDCTATEFNYARAEGLLFGNYGKTIKPAIEKGITDNFKNGKSYVEIFTVSEQSYKEIYKKLVDSDGISEIAIELRNKNGNMKFTQYQAFENKEMYYIQFVLS